MYIIKNSIANIGRNKGRNLIMGLILLVMIFTIAVSVIINTSTNSTIEYYKKLYGAEVVMARNNDKIPKDALEYKTPNIKDMQNYADSNLLKGSIITASSAVSLINIKTLDQGVDTGKGAVSDILGGDNSQDNMPSVNAFAIASSDKDINEEFKKGLRKIVKGSVYKGKNEVIISQALATHSKLNIGDKMTIKVFSPYDSMMKANVEVIITGIYEDNAPVNDFIEYKTALTNRGNEVLMGLETGQESGLFDHSLASVTGSFVLNNPKDLEKLKKEFTSKGLPEYFELIADSNTYDKVVGPLQGLSSITKVFTIALLVFGSIILITISNIAIRERKYEIGVLRAIGMKKGKVSLGLVTEMLIITAVSLGIGLGLASATSKPVANMILSSQVEEAKQDSGRDQIASKYVTVSTTVAVPIDKIDTQLDSQAITQIILISIILAMISSATGIMYITKFEPMKILTERN